MSASQDQSLHIALVVQRYGDRVVGGAESHARQYAERLAKMPEVEVTVLTTTAKDYVTWKNFFPAGPSRLNNVNILRFGTARERRQKFFGPFNHIAGKVFKRTAKFAAFDAVWRLCERVWYHMQGPVAPHLLGHIATHADDYDAFLFVTYLYAPTAYGLPLVSKKAMLVPTLHDEAPAYFSTTRRLFRKAAAILPSTAAEVALINRIVPGNEAKIQIAGVGLDPQPSTAPWPNKIPQRPYLLYLGRVSAGKNVDQLIAWFVDYRKHHKQNDLLLVLAGERETNVIIPEQTDVLYVGFVDEQQKHALLIHATAIINPSQFESLSLIVLEALQLGKPVVVNAKCAVLKDYATHVKTVFAYEDQKDFEAYLQQVSDPRWLNAPGTKAELAAGQRWIEQKFAWQAIIERIINKARELKVGARK